MDMAEFKSFMSTARSAFPGLEGHFRNLHSDQQWEAAVLWQRALEDVDIRLARDALERMIRGDLPRPEYGWADFPRLIRLGAAQIEAIEAAQRREEFEARDAQKCPICHDDRLGEVRIWNPWLVEAVGEKLMHCHHVSEIRNVWRRWHRADVERRPGGLHLGAVCSCESLSAKLKRAVLDEYHALPPADRSRWRRTHYLPGVVGVFAAERYCIWAEFKDRESRLALFKNWYENERQEPVPRYQEFDEWAN